MSTYPEGYKISFKTKMVKKQDEIFLDKTQTAGSMASFWIFNNQNTHLFKKVPFKFTPKDKNSEPDHKSEHV